MIEFMRYVRGNNGNGIGAVTIIEENGKFGLGISMCHPTDKFSKADARNICTNRANEAIKNSPIGFYELVDYDWYDDVLSFLPSSKNRESDVDKIITAIFSLVDDVVMDYARRYYRTFE